MNDTTNEMLLRVYRSLDFETTPSYTLTIKAAVGVILFSETSICCLRFGNEEAQRRQRQQEKERAKKDQAAADAANAAKAMRKVKHTQASIGQIKFHLISLFILIIFCGQLNASLYGYADLLHV